ncbi:MAG TPA: Ni/Fe-hydrogenase, b-type cytochrome subunit [Longimicrobiales bacterium]
MSTRMKVRPPNALNGTISLAKRVPPPSGEYRWVELWHWPIRAMHWVSVTSIVLLIVTGLYIGNPYLITGGDTSAHFLMGWMRFGHFVSAAVLIATGLLRVYWLFVGNVFERWESLFPFTKRDWRNLVRQLKWYLMLETDEVPHYLGHNPIQQISYTALYAVAIVQVLTGLALYGQANPGGFFWTTFGWVPSVIGGLRNVRFVHHIFTWLFLMFLPVHVYLAIRADLIERSGTVSSMFSGGRFARRRTRWVDAPDNLNELLNEAEAREPAAQTRST